MNKNFMIECVIGAETEYYVVRSVPSGQILYAGEDSDKAISIVKGK